ncbi:MAG: hypothetical protein IJS53_03625 [Clostridia bacterium]|nr:hypothetical protein [Clostridia bacterium]
MEENALTCAALPLRADESLYALVLGTREGMRSFLGSHAERLERRIDPDEWAVKPEVCCLIGDASAPVELLPDDAKAPATLAGKAVRILHARWQAGRTGLAILPCADREHNGEHLKEAMIACAVNWGLGAVFLRWLVEEARCRSTLTDCAEWLIEGEDALPLGEAAGAARFVKDLAPHHLRRRRMLGGAGMIVAAAGFLCGVNTIGEAMRDADLRVLLGGALTEELSAGLPFSHTETLEYAARVCAYLENACGGEAWPQMGQDLAARFVACVLPAIAETEKREGALPPRLCFALSALIMLYAGVREKQDGEYVLPSESGEVPLLENEMALAAFSRLSCDMPPESLAYAALSDTQVWGCDLREIEGLEDKVAAQLRDMQLLGVRGAMKAVCE